MPSGSTEGLVAGLWRALTRRPEIGGRRYPPVAHVLLAGLGALLLLVVATTAWRIGTDEQAYWQAAQRLAVGQPLYDPFAAPNTPFAYWYPPPLAQVLAPFTSFMSADAFTIGWTIVLLACLWWLAGRDVLLALAFIAFLPVAVELRTRNVHLVLAVLVVLALRRSWVFWVAAAAIKIAPALGAVYLLAAGRVREAIGVGLLGGAVLAVSYVLAPGAWGEFLSVVGARAGTDGGALVAIPFPVRFVAGGVLAAIGGRLGGHRGEILLVIGLTLANPTLWATALSLLVAVVPLLRSRPGVRGEAARVPSATLAEA
jgi:glycosyl transferase family 87